MTENNIDQRPSDLVRDTLPDAGGATTAYAPVTVTQSDVRGGGVAARIVQASGNRHKQG